MDAEGVRMLYFSLQEGVSAKVHWWSKVKLPFSEIGIGEDGKLLCCPVPEYYTGRRGWEEEKLTECLNEVIHRICCEEYYLQPELAGMLGIGEPFPPEILLHGLLRQVPCMEYLCLIGWEEEQELLRELLDPYFPRINHVSVVWDVAETSGGGKYEEFGEYIYWEYGIPIAGAERLSKSAGRDGRTVILDRKKDYRIPWAACPAGAVYVDFWSVEEKRKLLGKFRRDVKYLSVVNFLDTIAKNGYNSTVNGSGK